MKKAEYKTGQLLVQLGNMVTWFRNQSLQCYNLTSEQAGIISYLQQSGNEGITTGELAKQLHHSKATVSGMLKKMERKSLVRRYEDPKDSRKKHVFLTEQGLAKVVHLNQVSAENEQIILWGLSGYEQSELNRLLELALKNMNSFRILNHTESSFAQKEDEIC